VADLPLAGIRVVDLTRILSGPFCAMLLADLGADVVKIEGPGEAGDYARGMSPGAAPGEDSYFFRLANRNKRSLRLDLKKPPGVEAFLRLAMDADVIVESFRPGVVDKLGIGYDVVRETNPAVVYCAITGYGQTGPWRDRPGHDVNYVAAAGALAFPGQWLKAPSRSSLAVADMAGGSFAAIAVLSSLHQRNTTGKAASLDLSLFEAAFFWAAMRHSLDKKVDPRAHLFPVNDIFETKDGKRLTLGILEEHFWKNFVAFVPELADEAFSTDAKRRANGDRLSALIEKAMKKKTAAEWLALCDEHDVPVDPVLVPGEAAELEQIRARKDVTALGGELFATFPVFANGARGGSLRRGVPEAGEHTREILVELKFDDAEIADLKKAGAVK